jgi:hypothetical protein
MSRGANSAIQLFRDLFVAHPAHIALLDADGLIVAVNDAWRAFGEDNGLRPGYRFEQCDYVEVCQDAAVRRSPLAEEAMLGLLRVLKAGDRSYSMVYPCHAPGEPRWFRMWVQSQLPEVDAVVVAHSYLGRDLGDPGVKQQADRPSGDRPEMHAAGIEFPWLYIGRVGLAAG